MLFQASTGVLGMYPLRIRGGLLYFIVTFPALHEDRGLSSNLRLYRAVHSNVKDDCSTQGCPCFPSEEIEAQPS